MASGKNKVYWYVIHLLGDSEVGKSCLLSKFAYDKYTCSPFQRTAVNMKTIEMDDKMIVINLMDIQKNTYNNVFPESLCVHGAVFV